MPYKKKRSEDERKEDFKEQKNQPEVSIMYSFMYTTYKVIIYDHQIFAYFTIPKNSRNFPALHNAIRNF